MALQVPLRRLGLATRAAALTAHELRPRPRGVGSCSGGTEPPCATCEPAAQPACRARPPTARRALRVVCCPPPRGARPPCPPRDPTCGLTCRDAIDQDRTISTRARVEKCPVTAQSCGGETDRVARRLALAERARRRDYESEAARAAADDAAAKSAAAPAAIYRLGGERECARATDGNLYTVPAPAPARCGPDRTPPPPRCVELAPDHDCRIRGEARLDPCAHRPRVMIAVDRSEVSAAARKASSTDAGAAPSHLDRRLGNSTSRKSTNSDGERFASPERSQCRCSNFRGASTEGLTSRIIKTLNLGGNAGSGGGGANCPRAACGGECAGGGARRAGDDSWCAAPPPPAHAPARCQRPGLADRLRARSAPPRAGPRCGRELHTSAAVGAGGAGSLDETLRRRSELKEAGRGRVVAAGEGSKRAESPGGRLDLPVPPGTRRVRVRVSLDGAGVGPCAGVETAPPPAPASRGAVPAQAPVAPPAPASAPDPCRCLAEDRQNSWLSIKNIQKKLSGSRRGDEPQGEGGVAARARPACPPRPPADPARPAPQARPACPPPCPGPPRTTAAPPPPSSACGGRRPKDSEARPKKCISTVILPPDSIVAGS